MMQIHFGLFHESWGAVNIKDQTEPLADWKPSLGWMVKFCNQLQIQSESICAR